MPYQPGDIILEKYRIEALIGKGAYGEVYRVTHLGLGVLRAIKVLRRDAPGLGNEEFDEYYSRFNLEAHLGALLNTPKAQPHLIQVHDFIQEGEVLVLEMEDASGGSLRQRVDEAKEKGIPISVEDAVRIALEAAQGLAVLHSHREKIVHRDIHPGNILFGSQEEVKIADLGCAQTAHPFTGRSLLGSLSPPHPGHPDYRSPEHEIRERSLTSAADIYMLGAVVFEVLTGQRYNSLRPGTRARTLRGDVHEWLDDMLVSMLERDAEGRLWDGAEVVELLEEGIEQENVKRKAEQAAREVQARAREAAEAEAKRKAEEQAHLEAERRKAEANRLEKEAQAKADAEKRVRERAERKANRAAAWLRTRQAIFTFIRKWWRVFGIILLLALIAGLLNRQYKNQVWPFFPTPTPSQTLTPTLTYIVTLAPLPTATPRPSNTFTPIVADTLTETPEPTDTPLPTVTKTPRPSHTPSPTVDADSTIYDNFNNPSNDGKFSKNLWGWGDHAGDAIQQSGIIGFFHEASEEKTELYARIYDDFRFGDLNVFEARIKLDSAPGTGNIHMVISTTDWSTECLIHNYSSGIYASCFDTAWPTFNGFDYQTPYIETDFGSWHTMRIEVDPSTVELNFYIDGKFVGSHIPSDADVLKNARFSFKIGTWSPYDFVEGYVDDVRITYMGE